MVKRTEKIGSGRPFPGFEDIYLRAQSVATKHMSEIIAKTISSADKYLYDICQQDQTSSGSPNIENLRLLRDVTSSIESRFLGALAAVFRVFLNKASLNMAEGADLQLIDIEDMDDVVSAELVSEALVRNFGDTLKVTSQRLCILIGLDLDEQANSPLSDKSLGSMLRKALLGLEVPLKVRATLYRCYESALTQSVADMLNDINAPMLALGILPVSEAPESVRESEPAPVDQIKVDDIAPHAKSIPVSGANQKYSAEKFGAIDESSSGTQENILFDEICNLLQAWRPHANKGGNGHLASEREYAVSNDTKKSQARRSLSKHEMISLLSSMQGVLSDNVYSAMSTSDASLSAILKNEMLNSARNMGIPPDSVSIMREDEDALDLVGMLFDVLMSERDFRDEAKTMISRLLVPYTKAAVLDRRLFLTKAHPARKLLNVLTEAIDGNKGDGPQERELLSKAESTVEKLVSEFNEDIAIFEMLEQELRAFLDQHRRRVDLAEKRAREAQQGQDRLEHARMLAKKALDDHCQSIELPLPFHEFFTRYWTHHLSMLALRDSENSLVWDAALRLADDLIASFSISNPQARYDDIAQKRIQIESVLASSGVLGEPATAIIRQMLDSASHFNHLDSDSATASTVASVSSQSPTLSESHLRMVFNKDALDYDAHDVEMFKTVPVGTWLQLESSNGGFTPIKLAWISPISSRLMFVNRRGVRVLVVSVEELAQMKKQGKLIVHSQDNVFEQTMGRVLDRLKSDFGG